MTHITYTARVFAYLASQPPGSATSEQDLHALPPIWERLDTYDTWIRSCLALTQTATASEVNAVDLAMLQVSPHVHSPRRQRETEKHRSLSSP